MDTVVSSGSASGSGDAGASTADIAASVISDVESGNTESAAAVDEGTTQAASTEAQGDPDDFDAQPAERVDALGRKRENAIPHGRVKTMMTRAEQKMLRGLAKTLGFPNADDPKAVFKVDEITGRLTETSQKYADYDKRFKNYETVEEIMNSDEDRFVRMLAEALPEKYGKFLKVFEAAQEQTQAQSPQAAQTGDDPEPEPDFDLGNGQFTYSLEGTRKRDAWKERQFEKKMQAALDARFKPIDEAQKKAAEAAALKKQQETTKAQAEEKINQEFDRASKWPGFNENAAEILKVFKSDPALTLHDAWIQVYLPKLQANRDAMRTELLSEINGKPRSTSAATSTAAAKSENKNKTTADYAREAMKEFAS